MTTPLIGDSSDRTIELAKSAKVQGWDAQRWLQFVADHPDASLPAGVGGLIVSFQRGLVVRAAESQTVTVHHRQPSEAFTAALEWHRSGLRVSPNAPSVRHVSALLAQWGITDEQVLHG